MLRVVVVVPTVFDVAAVNNIRIISVGFFGEVTITHKTTDELRESLRAKLAKLVEPAEEAEDAVIIDGDALDVDAELGLSDD